MKTKSEPIKFELDTDLYVTRDAFGGVEFTKRNGGMVITREQADALAALLTRHNWRYASIAVGGGVVTCG